MMRVLITGATGFIGKYVVSNLLDRGHDVVVLTRDLPQAKQILPARCEFYFWRPQLEFPPREALVELDAVINLLGENIAAKRWTKLQKKKMYHSLRYIQE